MPFKPRALDESARSRSYQLMWLGLPDALILLVAVLIGAETIAMLAASFAAGTMIVPLMTLDEVVEKQISFASRWAVSAAAVCLIAANFPDLRDYPLDPALAFAVIAVVFHSALTWQRLKDR